MAESELRTLIAAGETVDVHAIRHRRVSRRKTVEWLSRGRRIKPNAFWPPWRRAEYSRVLERAEAPDMKSPDPAAGRPERAASPAAGAKSRRTKTSISAAAKQKVGRPHSPGLSSRRRRSQARHKRPSQR